MDDDMTDAELYGVLDDLLRRTERLERQAYAQLARLDQVQARQRETERLLGRLDAR